MKKIWLSLALAAPLFASVAHISAIRGDAIIVRDGREYPAKINDKLEPADVIKTTAKSRLQVIFSDATVATIGRNTTFKIEDVRLDGKNSAMKLEVPKGSFKVISGEIAKLARQNFALQADTATIGIRGTVFVGEISPQASAVACLSGAIDVRQGGVSKRVNAGKQLAFTPGKLGAVAKLQISNFTLATAANEAASGSASSAGGSSASGSGSAGGSSAASGSASGTSGGGSSSSSSSSSGSSAASSSEMAAVAAATESTASENPIQSAVADKIDASNSALNSASAAVTKAADKAAQKPAPVPPAKDPDASKPQDPAPQPPAKDPDASKPQPQPEPSEPQPEPSEPQRPEPVTPPATDSGDKDQAAQDFVKSDTAYYYGNASTAAKLVPKTFDATVIDNEDKAKIDVSKSAIEVDKLTGDQRNTENYNTSFAGGGAAKQLNGKAHSADHKTFVQINASEQEFDSTVKTPLHNKHYHLQAGDKDGFDKASGNWESSLQDYIDAQKKPKPELKPTPDVSKPDGNGGGGQVVPPKKDPKYYADDYVTGINALKIDLNTNAVEGYGNGSFLSDPAALAHYEAGSDKMAIEIKHGANVTERTYSTTDKNFKFEDDHQDIRFTGWRNDGSMEFEFEDDRKDTKRVKVGATFSDLNDTFSSGQGLKESDEKTYKDAKKFYDDKKK